MELRLQWLILYLYFFFSWPLWCRSFPPSFHVHNHCSTLYLLIQILLHVYFARESTKAPLELRVHYSFSISLWVFYSNFWEQICFAQAQAHVINSAYTKVIDSISYGQRDGVGLFIDHSVGALGRTNFLRQKLWGACTPKPNWNTNYEGNGLG